MNIAVYGGGQGLEKSVLETQHMITSLFFFFPPCIFEEGKRKTH